MENVNRKPFRQISANSRIFQHIQVYSDTFWNNQAYSGILQAYSDIFRTLCNPDIFRTLAYSEPWHIQKSGIFRIRDIFRTLAYSEIEAYSEPCKTSAMAKTFAKIINCRVLSRHFLGPVYKPTKSVLDWVLKLSFTKSKTYF